MSNIFRAFPALKAMTGNVRDYIMGQLSSTGEEATYLAPLFDNWMRPELAGKENTLLGPLVLEGGFGYKKSDTTLYDLCHDSDNPLDCTLHPVLYEMLRSKHLASSERTVETRRKPYEHQLQAYRVAKNHQSLIVSAGTGSGKTECFFYPIISEILKESAEARQRRGIRAIILYPTNALIHSQEERLTEYLNTEANRQLSRPISFCLYNGALEPRSPESTFYRINNRQDLYNVDAAANEYGTPDIVLTNFSMLEYMLLRKKDRDILSATSVTLKHIVLDEAHTYTGANATEMALQIRRMLLAMQSSNINHQMPNVQYYATSATFAGNRDSLHHFASTLFFNSDDPQVIEGRRYAPDVPFEGPADIDIGDYRESLLGLNTAERVGSEGIALENVYDVFNFNEIERNPEQLARFLWRIPVIRSIYEWLRRDGDEKSYRFENLCTDIFGNPTNEDRGLIAILMDVASLALFNPAGDVDKVPLIPVRWHAAVRKFEGAFACTDPNCRFKQAGLPAHVGKIYSSWREECECGGMVLPLAFCKKCGSPVLICKNDGNISTPSLKNVIGAFFDSDDSDENQWRNSSIELLSFEGAPNNIIRGTALYSVDNDSLCPHCGYSEVGRKKFCQTLIHNKPLFTSLILEGLWPELPVAGTAGNMWPSCGRHIISFSDTRQNAAQLAPTMENTFLRNTAYQIIYRVLGGVNHQYQELTLEEILERIGNADDIEPSEVVKLAGLANCDMKTKKERIAQLKLHVAYFLLNLPAGRYTPSLENAGIIECVYEGLDRCQYPRDIALFHTDEEYQDFLYMCLQSLRNRTSFDYQSSLKWLDKKFVDYFPYHNSFENVLSIYMENLAHKMGDVGTILNTDGTLPSVLEQVILESLAEQEIIAREGRTAKVKVGSMKFRIRQNPLWECNETCRSIYKNIRGLSPFGNNTNGEGSEIREVLPGTRFSRLWRTVNGEVYAFYAKEHSAQLKVKENKASEALFKENLLNMLSCTTTMEMGIDVGALASVMLANTPPTPANYAQRAGRAGRRGEGATLIFTITSASPHDEMFYHKPDWAFVTSMLVPEVTLTNRTLVQRAVNAWLIRELCQDFLDRQNANNIFDAYSTYGLFFKSLRDSKVLDWRSNEESLLFKLVNTPEVPRCALLRRQISDLLQGSGFEENWNLENNDSFVKTLIKSLSDLNDDIVRKIGLIKEDSRRVQIRINELGVEKLDVEDTEDEKRIDSEIARNQALLNSYTKEKNTLMNGSGNASDALKNSTISYLVDHQVFPSHGLPINVVSLDVMENKEDSQYPVLCEKFDLSRSREQAIRNFAPGNEVVVAGARYRSLGIRVDFRQRFGVAIPEDREDFISPIYVCPRCKTIFNERQDHDCCPNCVNEEGNAISLKSQKKIEPEAFVTNVGPLAKKEGVKNPAHMPYKVVTVVDGRSEDRNGNVFCSLKFIPSAHVHTYNSGYGEGFTYCKSCYAVFPWTISNGTEYNINRNFGAPNGSPVRCRDHHNFSKKENSFFLYSHYVTNAIEIHINDEFRNPLVSFDESIRNTLGIALKIAITRTLEIEDKEINFALPTEHQIQDGCDLILYDTNVGGVGYIDRIAGNIFDKLLTVAVRDVLLGSEEHQQICHGACPQCLISYGTQFLFQNEATAPDRIHTLSALNVDRILDNGVYDVFYSNLTQQGYAIKDVALIKNQIATADTLKIKLNSLSSDIFSSPLWECIRDRRGSTQIQLTRAPQDDNEKDIAVRMRGIFGNQSVVVVYNNLPLGFYMDDGLYDGLFNWATMSAIDPLNASDDNPRTSWMEKRNHFEYGDVQVWQEIHALNSHSHLWTESESKNRLPALVKVIFDTLFEDGRIPNEIGTAVSWIYEDEYALTPAPAGKKDVLKEIFAYLGIDRLLQDPGNGLIRYLDRGNTYYEDIANIQCVPNAHETGELHDRRFRIKLADGRWFILSMGKGLASFVSRNGRYVKLPGHLSWSIQDLAN